MRRRKGRQKVLLSCATGGDGSGSDGTPSNAMAASTPSWTRSTKRRRKRRPRPGQDGSTISASLRGRSPHRRGSGVSGKPLQDAGFPASSPPEAAGLCPARPPSVRRRWWRTKGGKVEGATPFLPFKVRHRAGMTIAQQIAHFSSSFRGGRSLHSDPCGKAVESARKPTAEKQQTTNGPQAETGKLGGCTQPNISDSQRGQRAAPLDGLGLRVDTRLTCPPTSWSVQWVPFQKEGYNEGTAAG